MSWRDQLRKGSFRGVEFLTTSADSQFGRRTVTHEYPLRDKPYVEDLGRKAREFTVEAFVLGADYMTARDALIAAIEAPGSGKLVHHYHGELTVAVKECRLRESTEEGGMARFTLTFIEAGENAYPSSRIDTPAVVNRAADISGAVVEENFADSFKVDGYPEWVRDAAVDKAGNVLDLLTSVTASLPTLAPERAAILSRISGASNSLSTLILTPLTMARTLTSTVVDLVGIVQQPVSALAMYRKLFAAGGLWPTVPRTTPSRIRQADNQAALANLIRRTAVIEAARASSSIDFDSFQSAASVRDELAEQLDTEMQTADDTVYFALADLRAATVKDITARGADLARVVKYTPMTTLPALVVAHNLYGDATRAAEISTRNRVKHPGFIPGGYALEVLTNA